MAVDAETRNDSRVLVAYASRGGASRGVAERIAARLRERPVRVELAPVHAAGSIRAYDAVVVGSAVYDQRWLPEAEEFVRVNLGLLAARPVWLFSVGSFGDRKRIIGPLMKREPKGIGDVLAAVRPRGYRVFAGVIERHQWPFFSRLFFRALGGRFGDNRHWHDIDAWAEEIAQALPVPRPANAGRRAVR